MLPQFEERALACFFPKEGGGKRKVRLVGGV